MKYRATASIEAPVKPTEVAERVADAVRELFENADVEIEDDRVTAETHDLGPFRDTLYQQEILDTARAEFFRNQVPGGFSFDLKKQAALQGVVNFSVGSPDELGDIHVEVDVEDPDVETFITYLAPETRDGTPIED